MVGICIAIPDLLATQMEKHDLAPSKLIYDQEAGTGKAACEVKAVTKGKTQLVVKPKATKVTHSETFGPTGLI